MPKKIFITNYKITSYENSKNGHNIDNTLY